MNKFIICFCFTVLACHSQAQKDISVKEVGRIESVLAADELKGRKAGSPEIEKAASFIADEFKKTGLQAVQGNSYLQEFL